MLNFSYVKRIFKLYFVTKRQIKAQWSILWSCIIPLTSFLIPKLAILFLCLVNSTAYKPNFSRVYEQPSLTSISFQANMTNACCFAESVLVTVQVWWQMAYWINQHLKIQNYLNVSGMFFNFISINSFQKSQLVTYRKVKILNLHFYLFKHSFSWNFYRFEVSIVAYR